MKTYGGMISLTFAMNYDKYAEKHILFWVCFHLLNSPEGLWLLWIPIGDEKEERERKSFYQFMF